MKVCENHKCRGSLFLEIGCSKFHFVAVDVDVDVATPLFSPTGYFHINPILL